jgi:hypothetical protein
LCPSGKQKDFSWQMELISTSSIQTVNLPEQNVFDYLSQTASKKEYIHIAMVSYPIS